jgi:hypothetical protein
MQQAAAKTHHARHKAKTEIDPFSLGEVLDPATSRTQPQGAANASFSACEWRIRRKLE